MINAMENKKLNRFCLIFFSREALIAYFHSSQMVWGGKAPPDAGYQQVILYWKAVCLASAKFDGGQLLQNIKKLLRRRSGAERGQNIPTVAVGTRSKPARTAGGLPPSRFVASNIRSGGGAGGLRSAG